MASFIVDQCRVLETWVQEEQSLGDDVHTSDHRRFVWYENQWCQSFLQGARSFTEEENKTKIQIPHMSDFLCGEMKVRNDP